MLIITDSSLLPKIDRYAGIDFDLSRSVPKIEFLLSNNHRNGRI
jgi:hypothetical protein